MLKIARILSAFIIAGAGLLASSAFAYCVYNKSNFQTIVVQDKDYGKPFKFWVMGPRSVAFNGSACCEGSKRGCNKGAYIKAVATDSEQQATNSKPGFTPTPGPGPSGTGIICKHKVKAHGYVRLLL